MTGDQAPSRSQGEAQFLQLRIVRVYGSNTSYGNAPRLPLWAAARELRDVVPGNRSLFVELGAPVEWVFEAVRRGRAYGQVMLEALFGAKGDGGTREARISELMTSSTLLSGRDEHDWYVTIWAERFEPIDEDQVNGPLGLPNPFAADEQEVAATKDTIDRVAGAIGLVLDLSPLTAIISDRLIVSGPGIDPYMVPRPSVSSPNLSVGKIDAPTALLDQTLAALSRRGSSFDGGLRWLVAALEERDPLKRFLWSFLALEELIQSHAPSLRDRALATIRARSEINLSDSLFHAQNDQQLAVRFAYLAYALRPDDAASDCADFATLVKARNDWSHGRGDLSQPPRLEGALTLFRKYATILLNG